MSEELAAVQEQTLRTRPRRLPGSCPPERWLSARQLVGYLDRLAFAVIGS